MKSRILILFAGLMLLWSILILRAGILQLWPNDRLKALHERQFQTVVTLQNRRGAIVDRKNRELALSTQAYSVYADPKIISNKKRTAQRLAKILGHSPATVLSKIKDEERRFVWISRLISPDRAVQIRELDIRGISLVEEFKRVYPNEKLLAQTLGMVGNEGQGLEGLELHYDQQLRGNKKKIAMKRDARGRPLIAEGMMFAENPDGAEIKLTIDSEIQHMLENELAKAVSDYEADQAFGVILDVNTSQILAMVSTHFFDANSAMKAPAAIRRNRVITDTFEPGSTMKTFAIAGALKEKIVTPNKKYKTENGTLKVADRIIREAESTHHWSQLTVSEILAYSSNIGTAKIAFEMGDKTLRQTLTDFGFGSKLGVDLPGEAKGVLHPVPWNQHLLSNISFGQGIAVTPLQVANAYAAIANGGVLNTPYIVQSYRDVETNEVVDVKVKPIRRVLSQEDAAAMKLMLAGATADGGTGVNARVEGFMIAGKTGTAQKPNPNGKGYLPSAYISSFAGFFPVNDPKYVIYVVVDHPKKVSYYGSAVAAPVFSRVASYTARLEGLAPVLLSEKNLVGDPEAVKKALKKRKLSPQQISRIIKPKPDPDEIFEQIDSTEKKTQTLRNFKTPEVLSSVPDLKNLSLREVLGRVAGQEIEVRIIGQGLVYDVSPAPGMPMPDSRTITVFMQ